MLPGQNPLDPTPSPNRGLNARQRRAARRAGIIPPSGTGPEQVATWLRLRADLEEGMRRWGEAVKLALRHLSSELDTLRLSVKYLAFDLEATRRERDAALDALRRFGIGGGS